MTHWCSRSVNAMLGMCVNIMPLKAMVSLRSIGTPLRMIAAPPNSCRFKPVAVTMMSAAISSPEASLMPVFGEPLDGVGDDVGLARR